MRVKSEPYNPLREQYPDSESIFPARSWDRMVGNYVYFLRNTRNGCIKIGISWNVRSRLRQLQGRCAHRLECLVYFRDQEVVWERRLHKYFAAARLDGEWFEPVPELMALIAWIQSRQEGRSG